MNKQEIKIFAKLCESVVNEASTLPDIIKKHPQGPQLLKIMHGKTSLPHDAKFHYVDKLLWNDIKMNGGWALFYGPYGVAGLRYLKSSEKYEVTAINKDGVFKLTETKGGRILEFIKSHIGNIRYLYSSADNTTPTDSKRELRQQRKPSSNNNTGSIYQETQKLIMRLFPVINKMISNAENDVKGMMTNALKHGNLPLVKKKLAKLEKFQEVIEYLASNKGNIDKLGFNSNVIWIKDLIGNAVSNTYAYFEPNDVSWHNNTPTPKHTEKYQKFINSIHTDTKKLGAILGFLKQEILL